MGHPSDRVIDFIRKPARPQLPRTSCVGAESLAENDCGEENKNRLATARVEFREGTGRAADGRVGALNFLEAFGTLCWVRLGLRLFRFDSFLRSLLRDWPTSLLRVASMENPEVAAVVRAVLLAAAAGAGARCLHEALTAKILLDRRGYALRLRIGAAPAGGPPQSVIYHAWLESVEHVLVGGEESPMKYIPVPLSICKNRDPNHPWKARIRR